MATALGVLVIGATVASGCPQRGAEDTTDVDRQRLVQLERDPLLDIGQLALGRRLLDGSAPTSGTAPGTTRVAMPARVRTTDCHPQGYCRGSSVGAADRSRGDAAWDPGGNSLMMALADVVPARDEAEPPTRPRAEQRRAAVQAAVHPTMVALLGDMRRLGWTPYFVRCGDNPPLETRMDWDKDETWDIDGYKDMDGFTAGVSIKGTTTGSGSPDLEFDIFGEAPYHLDPPTLAGDARPVALPEGGTCLDHPDHVGGSNGARITPPAH